MNSVGLILAGGRGTRMKSHRPKAMQLLGGLPLVTHVIRLCESSFDRVAVVVGPGMGDVSVAAAPHEVLIQDIPLGTAHAALAGEPAFGDGLVFLLYVDNPLIQKKTVAELRVRLEASAADLALLAMRAPPDSQYGRVIMRDGKVQRIVEWSEANAEERKETLCNAGLFAARSGDLRRWLKSVKPRGAAGEYYLTDIVELAAAEGAHVVAHEANFAEAQGVNSRADLAVAEATLQGRLRLEALEGGVRMVAPETVFLAADTRLAEDVTIEPFVVFGPGVEVEFGARIRAFSYLEQCQVKSDAIIGPYARLRPGTLVGEGAHIGNFVELKAATIGAGVKANHLSYLGDTTIGPKANIGAGTIVCNYDGRRKHRTDIGARAFIGSNSSLVAPVTIGDDSLIGAGSVITKDVSAETLAIARAPQVEKPRRRTVKEAQ